MSIPSTFMKDAESLIKKTLQEFAFEPNCQRTRSLAIAHVSSSMSKLIIEKYQPSNILVNYICDLSNNSFNEVDKGELVFSMMARDIDDEYDYNRLDVIIKPNGN